MSTRIYSNDVLRELWDDATRLYTKWDSAGVQVEQRPYTEEENTRADAEAVTNTAERNREAIEAKAKAAITANNNFLALSSPTNAQTLAQVKVLTRENTALIRLVLGELNSQEGT